jgi:hypothetical protein
MERKYNAGGGLVQSTLWGVQNYNNEVLLIQKIK